MKPLRNFQVIICLDCEVLLMIQILHDLKAESLGRGIPRVPKALSPQRGRGRGLRVQGSGLLRFRVSGFRVLGFRV